MLSEKKMPTNLHLKLTTHILFSVGTILGRFDQSTRDLSGRVVSRLDYKASDTGFDSKYGRD